jgi:hypothetical protein
MLPDELAANTALDFWGREIQVHVFGKGSIEEAF